MPIDVNKYIKKKKKPTCLRIIRILIKTFLNFFIINWEKYKRFVAKKYEEREEKIKLEQLEVKEVKEEATTKNKDIDKTFEDIVGCGCGCLWGIGCLYAIFSLIAMIIGVFTGSVHISATTIIIVLLILILLK